MYAWTADGDTSGGGSHTWGSIALKADTQYRYDLELMNDALIPIIEDSVTLRTETRQGTSSTASDPCTNSLGTISGTASQDGTWSDDCESEVSGRGYARYYSFTLTEDAEVTVDLTSGVDTYLYLREGSATSGTARHSNDDIESGNTDSRIVATLSAGTYTIEATTYAEGHHRQLHPQRQRWGNTDTGGHRLQPGVHYPPRCGCIRHLGPGLRVRGVGAGLRPLLQLHPD